MSSTANNLDTHSAQNDEFHPRRAGAEPLTTKGHKPGVKASPYDNVPEFHVEAHPPGTAPPQTSHVPQTEGLQDASQTPEEAAAFNSTAADTLGGSTSGTVHNATQYGKPLQGQDSRELRHDGSHTRSKDSSGLAGYSGAGTDKVRQVGGDLPEGVEKGTKGKAQPDYPAAEDRLPESASQVAAENSGPNGRAYEYGSKKQ